MEKDLDHLLSILIKIDNQKEMKNFILGLFTPQELIEIPMRVKIVEMLKKGVPQHDIAQKLRVGIATVTRGSKELQMGRFTTIK